MTKMREEGALTLIIRNIIPLASILWKINSGDAQKTPSNKQQSLRNFKIYKLPLLWLNLHSRSDIIVSY